MFLSNNTYITFKNLNIKICFSGSQEVNLIFPTYTDGSLTIVLLALVFILDLKHQLLFCSFVLLLIQLGWEINKKKICFACAGCL